MWTTANIECSLTYEELNGFDHADRIPNFWVDGADPLVFRVGGKGIARFGDKGTFREKLTGGPESMNLCATCNRATLWFEISFQAPFCSPRCTEIMWAAYWEAERKAGPY